MTFQRTRAKGAVSLVAILCLIISGIPVPPAYAGPFVKTPAGHQPEVPVDTPAKHPADNIPQDEGDLGWLNSDPLFDAAEAVDAEGFTRTHLLAQDWAIGTDTPAFAMEIINDDDLTAKLISDDGTTQIFEVPASIRVNTHPQSVLYHLTYENDELTDLLVTGLIFNADKSQEMFTSS